MEDHEVTGDVAGIVLAAGRSHRMGAPKALLDVGGRTFLRAAVAALREGGCARVVVAAVDSDIALEAGRAGAVVIEGSPDGEQVDTLRLALDAVERPDESVGPGARFAAVLPVDHPLVRPTTVRSLVEASAAAPDAVIRPVYQGRPGHPTLFPRSLWRSLRDPALPQGARTVVESPATRTVDVEVDDPGVVADIDTPEAYERYVSGVA